MNHRLSDYTLAGWLMIVSYLFAAVLGAIYWGRFLVWISGQAEIEVPNVLIALPGLIYLGMYWGICQWRGIRLMKPGRAPEGPPVPWRIVGIIVFCATAPIIVLLGILTINRLFNPL